MLALGLEQGTPLRWLPGSSATTQRNYLNFFTFLNLSVIYSQAKNQAFFQLILAARGNGSTSKCYFKGVVIDKFVDIEGGEKVKNVCVIDLPVDRRIQ